MTKHRITIDEIYKRDRGICHLCLLSVKRRDATRDHIIAKADGGTEAIFNLKLAHDWCNQDRMNKPILLSPAVVRYLTPEEITDYENGLIPAWELAKKVGAKI